jgi:hypothetical protein
LTPPLFPDISMALRILLCFYRVEGNNNNKKESGEMLIDNEKNRMNSHEVIRDIIHFFKNEMTVCYMWARK